MPTTLTGFMSDDHHVCDEAFAAAEQAALDSNWKEAETRFRDFRADMDRHFRMEEHELFPALSATGGPAGPVQIMLMEHAQMNGLIDQLWGALARPRRARIWRSFRNTADRDAAAQSQGRADALSDGRPPSGRSTGSIA